MNEDKPVWKHESSGYYLYNSPNRNWHVERVLGNVAAAIWSSNAKYTPDFLNIIRFLKLTVSLEL